jgi:hypothetical protein
VNVAIVKHSGQTIPFLIPKQQDKVLWQAFQTLVRQTNSSVDFLNSFTYKIDSLKPLLKHLAHDAKRIEHLFKNNFNENYKSNNSFYEALAKFVVAIHNFSHTLDEDGLKLLYGTLRFIHFIHNKDAQALKSPTYEHVVQN